MSEEEYINPYWWKGRMTQKQYEEYQSYRNKCYEDRMFVSVTLTMTGILSLVLVIVFIHHLFAFLLIILAAILLIIGNYIKENAHINSYSDADKKFGLKNDK